MKLKINKNVYDGCYVKIKGDKVVKCNKNPTGIIKNIETNKLIYYDFNGKLKRITYTLPAGIYIFGKIMMRIENTLPAGVYVQGKIIIKKYEKATK